MLICSGSASEILAQKIYRRVKGSKWLEIEKKKFPDGETYVKVEGEVKDEKVALVQSMYHQPNNYLMEFLIIADTLLDLGAQEIIGVIPYFAYARQDTRFTPGEAVTFDIVKKLISERVNKLIVVDIHQHRRRGIEKEFPVPTVNLTAASLFADYVRDKLVNPVVIGPDEESEQWVSVAAEKLGAEKFIFRKQRLTSEEVQIETGELNLKGRDTLIVDDIISTGGTMAKTVEALKSFGAKRVISACTHPVLAGKALAKIYKAGADEVLGTDTIPSEISFITVSGIIADELKKELERGD